MTHVAGTAPDSGAPPGAPEGWDRPNAMNSGSPPGATWTSTNAAEAVPGVQTPLGCSMFLDAGEISLRGAFRSIGALSRLEAQLPESDDDRAIGFHFGRYSLRVDALCGWADRIPGASGEAMAKQVFAHVPDGYVSRAQRRHYPRVAAKMAVPFLRHPRIVAADRTAAQRFWARSLRELPQADEQAARALLAEGGARFRHSFAMHTTLVLGAIQPAYELLDKLASAAGFEVQRLMVGHGGHEELEVLGDVWACSRGRLSVPDFLARHGYHGPNEGDVSAMVWRESPAPVERLIATYRDMPDSADPVAAESERVRQREAAEAEFLAALPRPARVVGRAALAIGNRYLPMRGVGKVSLLQGVDAVRAAARRLGELYAAAGLLEHPEDVFMLRFDELARGRPVAARQRVAQRRPLYDFYRTLEIPALWQGAPRPADPDDGGRAGAAAVIEGTAASPGAVEGPVRVVSDPAESDVEDGEILVARDTDPSWASLMFASAGLAADIGGIMSHTAIVARELGIPCVVNTASATRSLRTGDIVRLDGSAGTLEVLRRS